MVDQVLDGIVIGGVGLNDNGSWIIASPGSSCHLVQELKGSFSGPEVWQVEREVGKQSAHEGNASNIVPFGDHLRADQYVDGSFFPAPNQLFVSASLTCCIAVHACNSCLGHEVLQCLFDLLGADAYTGKARIAAFRAAVTGGAAKITVVTTGDFLYLVEGQGDAAMAAAQYVTAKHAL
jgi:hypothetical protein